jgi:predicted nucleic acid-binding protein
MEIVFLDTNAVVKLYIKEIGSTWIRAFVKGKAVYISEIVLFEVVTVIRRRHLEGEFNEIQARALIDQIRADCLKQYKIIDLRRSDQVDMLIEQAFNLPATMRVRALDGIHMAAASIVSDIAKNNVPPDPFTFVSSDVQFLRVMQQGYTVENPEDHP